MTFPMYVAWLFMGVLTRFFYQRIQRSKIILLIPFYFVLFLFFGFVFLTGLGVIIYLRLKTN